jgi:hypothetical protein
MNELEHNVILLEKTSRLLFDGLKRRKFKKRRLKIIEDEYMKILMIVMKSVFPTYEDYKRCIFLVEKELDSFINEKVKEFEA